MCPEAGHRMLLGAHVSIAGGIDQAIARGEEIGASAIQVFTANASRWQTRPLREAEISSFRQAYRSGRIAYVAAHDSYLINLASPDPHLRQRSIDRFHEELQRCHQLGIGDLVMHPGAHMGQGVAVGLQTISDALRNIFAQAPQDVRVLLENTAGQGSALGSRFEELAEILDRVSDGNLGVCFDTCHAFAAGYDLRDEDAYSRTMDDFVRLIGAERLALFHLNDSLKQLGSRVDRHQHVGRGEIGEAGFRALMKDPRWFEVPKIIETPGGEEHCEDKRNLALLRKLAGS